MSTTEKHRDADAGPWNGVITNVRISQTADPELYRELSKSSHRERSRRLRSLALLGLYAASRCDYGLVDGAVGMASAAPRAAPVNLVSETEQAQDPGMRDISKRMLGSLLK